MTLRSFVAGGLLVLGLALARAGVAQEVRVSRDVEYAKVGEHSLLLDLHVPASAKSPPLVLWIHGGAWRGGSKKEVPIAGLTERGYAIASVDYRLSPVAKFPAQVHDIKAALRYLRANAAKLGIGTEKIAIAGGSAGGHLAALVGVTNGVIELEGEVGQHRDHSSDVQAIVAFYGASNLTTILAQSTPHGLNVRTPALELFLGGQPNVKQELANLASPVFHVDKSDPPLLWFHGDQDPQMPINQAHEIVGTYKKHGLLVSFDVVYGGVHGGKLFYTLDQIERVAEFLAPLLPTAK
jgi:acetyl esterase/lipase